MKKSLTLFLTLIILTLVITGCSSAPDLNGQWRCTIKSGSTEIPVDMTISNNDTMEVKLSTGENGQAFILWTGSYTPPTNDEQPYSWTSKSDDGKENTFTYEDGKISGNLTLMNLTRSLTFERVQE